MGKKEDKVKRKLFELKDICYDSSILSYVFRIVKRKNSELFQVILDENGVEEKSFKKVEKLIKGSHTAKLAYSNRNESKEMMELVTFNIPQKKVAYKVIFHLESDTPEKVFISKKEGHWEIVDQVSEKLLKKITDRRELLKKYVTKGKHERPIIFCKE